MRIFKPMMAASALAFGAMLQATAAQAQEVAPPPPSPAVTVTVDEKGTGTIQFGELSQPMLSSLSSDLTREGGSALTYQLNAPSLVQGDVVLSEGANTSFVGSDVIRFLAPQLTVAALDLQAPSNFLLFYSDKGDGSDALADVGLPSQLFDNRVNLTETGSEGNNGAFYTPTANQPGYVSGFAVTYHFISDSAVPEPSTWALMLLGFGLCGVAVRRNRRNVAALA